MTKRILAVLCCLCFALLCGALESASASGFVTTPDFTFTSNMMGSVYVS